MNQPPVFGSPLPPPPEPDPDEATGGTRRTVVLAVAAGVVALGALGGTALVLTAGGSGTDDSALPAAPVEPVAPTSTPTTAPASPLPTAAVQGRNVFVPLVSEVTEGTDGSEGTSAPTADPGGTVPTGTATPGTGTGTPLPGPTVTVTQTATVVDTALVQALRDRIADLEAQLADSDDSDTIAALEAQIAQLEAELADAQDDPEYEFDVLVEDVVDPASAGTDVVFVVADESQPSGYAEYTVNAASPDRTFGAQGELTYVSYDPGTGIVTFTYVSNSYRVVEGTALGFTGPS